MEIKNWLSEYKTLSEEQLETYASTLRHNEMLIEELYDVFDGDLIAEVVDPICHQLFNFYRSQNPDLQRFTLELVPVLIATYLSSLNSGDSQQRLGSIEACLLGIYNLETVDKEGKPKVKKVTIPTLACSSVYHEPPSLGSLALTESTLMRYHSDRPVVISVGPMPQVESINSQNRLTVLTYVMNRYNADIGNISTRSHWSLCKFCCRLSRNGFSSVGDMAGDQQSPMPSRQMVSFAEDLRIPLNSTFLVELLNAIYFIMFNGQADDAILALEAIHWRASFDLIPDVLLVTNAIRNSLQMHPSNRPLDGPMGISIAIPQTQSTFSKEAITNASFRARKLPEDIEVVRDGEHPQALTSDEMGEGDSGIVLRALDLDKVKSSSVQKMSKGPLKSIMKKREEKAAAKSHRKESDTSASIFASAGKRGSHLKEFLDLHAPQTSPRHSMSVSAGLSTTDGQDSTPAPVANIMRSSSNRAMFDPTETTGRTSVRNSMGSNGDVVISEDINSNGSAKFTFHSRDSSLTLNGSTTQSCEKMAPVDLEVDGEAVLT